MQCLWGTAARCLWTCANPLSAGHVWRFCSCRALLTLSICRYAKSSKEKRIEWSKFTKDYFLNRGTLANVLLLIDASVPPQQVDVDCANWLGDAKIPFSVVFTKTDKRKKKCPPVAENMEAFRQLLLDEWEYLPAMFATSSKTSAGKEELLRYIAQLRNFFTESR